MKFIQQVFDEEVLELEETGELILKDEKKLKWVYLEPDYKVFIMEGNNYKFYDKENEQLTIGKLETKNQQLLWQLLFAKDISDKITCDSKKKTIYIKDDSESLDIEIYVNEEYFPIKMVKKDITGIKYVYMFSQLEKQLKFDDSIFELDVPKDVEIIRN